MIELPFSEQSFFRVFAEYHEALWPAPVLLTGLALVTAFGLFRRDAWVGRWVSGVLAVLWAWTGLAYHLAFFSRINSAAYLFALLSLVAAAVFVWYGVIQGRLRFAWPGGWRGVTGLVLLVFALAGYPLWVWLAGHSYPAAPTFGLPCPTTLFTLGVLAFLVRPYPRALFIVPLLWCVVGVQAALALDMPPDTSLALAAVAGAVLALRNR